MHVVDCLGLLTRLMLIRRGSLVLVLAIVVRSSSAHVIAVSKNTSSSYLARAWQVGISPLPHDAVPFSSNSCFEREGASPGSYVCSYWESHYVCVGSGKPRIEEGWHMHCKVQCRGQIFVFAH